MSHCQLVDVLETASGLRRAAKGVAECGWGTSISEAEHFERMGKMDTLRSILATIQAKEREHLAAGPEGSVNIFEFFAAAPELYSALEELVTAVIRKGCNDPEETGEETSADLYFSVMAALEKARVALAKARGGL